MPPKKVDLSKQYEPKGDPVRVVVFDSNAQARAVPQISSFKHWVQRVRTRGARLLVPEVVVNELCEHAMSEWTTAMSQSRSAEKLRTVITGEKIDVPPVTWEQVSDAIKNTGVEIITLDSDSALEGLLDQIRQSGPGEKRNGVKTGGADSAWIRSLIRHLESEGIEMSEALIVTADIKAISKVLASLELEDTPPQIVKGIKELEKIFPKTSSQWEDIAAEYIDDSLSIGEPRRQVDLLEDHSALDGLIDEAKQLVIEQLNNTMNFWQGDPFDWETQDDDYEIEDIKCVNVDAFEVDENVATFTVEIEATYSVVAQLAAQDVWGNTPVYCELKFPAIGGGTLYLSCDPWHASASKDTWECDWQLDDSHFTKLEKSDIEVIMYE